MQLILALLIWDKVLLCGTAGQVTFLQDSPKDCGTVGKYAMVESNVSVYIYAGTPAVVSFDL